MKNVVLYLRLGKGFESLDLCLVKAKKGEMK